MIACDQCDLVQQEVEISRHTDAHCIRCNAVLYRGSRTRLDVMIALTIASGLMYVVSNLFPIAALAAQGIYNSTTLIGTVLALYDQGRPLIAALVLMTTILVPGLELAVLLYMLIPLRLGRIPAGLPAAFRFLLAAHPWSMMEVYMLGILVTLIKLADLASIVPGISLWAFVGLIVLFSALSAAFSVRDFWRWVENARPFRS